MDRVKCIDIVKQLTDEATKQFGTLLREDGAKKDRLNACCVIIDKLIDKFNGVAATVDINDETTDIAISIVCDGFEIRDKNDEFYDLLRISKHFAVKAYEDSDDRIELLFTFDGIWIKNAIC